MILTVSLNGKYEPIPSSPRKVEFSQVLNQTLKQFCYSFFRIYYKGNNYREDYGKLGVLFALLPEISCIAMTATASRADINGIADSMMLKKCKYIIGNPDRKNIFYEKVFRHGQDLDSFDSILMPIAKYLLKKR